MKRAESMKKSLFKDWKLLISETNIFLKAHGTFLAQEANQTSTYFEMACYNYLIKYYESNNFSTLIKNLEPDTGAFRYKLTPTGYPENFSYFEVKKEYKKEKKHYCFELRQNVSIQSAFSKDIFLTPDFVVAKKGTLKTRRRKKYYKGIRNLRYYRASDLATFAESKNYNPSPELVVNYIGIINELYPSIIKKNKLPENKPKHLAPSLMISGKGNNHTRIIQSDLVSRYRMNIFYGLFYRKSQVYSKSHQNSIAKIGTR